ncbi:MAG: hypothetical protein LBD50_03935 [Rickettsiales bacterium]|nr:hypothetical protein [Rickettsiales bacterium]
MKKFIMRTIFVCFAVIFCCISAFAKCSTPACQPSETCTGLFFDNDACTFISSAYDTCTCGSKIYYTIECATDSHCGSGYTCILNECIISCTGCTNCTSDADWSAYGTGYQKKTTKSCSCNTCNSSTAYRCAAGYYGTSTNGTSGCEICPTGGTSVAGDNTTKSKCYASPPNGSDYSGNWQFMQTCYYTGQ